MDNRVLLPQRHRVPGHLAQRELPAGSLPARDYGPPHPAHPQQLPARVHHHRRRGDLPRHHHHVLAPAHGVYRRVVVGRNPDIILKSRIRKRL